MPDTDAPSRNDSHSASVPLERVNLPAVIPPPSQPEPARDQGDSWLTRVLRDVFGYMVRHAQVAPAAKARRKKPFPSDLDLKAIDLAVALSAATIIREILFVPPSMPAIDLL